MIARRAPLRPSAPPKRKSWLARSTKPIPQVNAVATKKRQARNAKRMRGAEYKAARAAAMERSGGRCEYEGIQTYSIVRLDRDTGKPVEDGRGYLVTDQSEVLVRCRETTRLQFHELRYPKSRPTTADDGLIYCYAHHMLTESKKLHKHGRPFRS